MTLVLSLGCPEFVLQVSDRRFTRIDSSGHTSCATDEGNKELVIRSPVLTAAVTFAGHAHAANKPIGDWLLDVVSTDAVEAGFDAVLSMIAEASNRELARPRSPFRGLMPHAFVIAGFELNANGRFPRSAVVTNCRDPRFKPDDATEHFFVFDTNRSAFFIEMAGCSAAMPANAKSIIRGLLRKGHSYPALADTSVGLIRTAKRHGKLGKYIGDNCLSICITPDGEAESVYHPNHRRPVTYGPNVMDAFASEGKGAMMFRGIETSGSGLSVGAQRLPIRDRRMLRRTTGR